PMKGAHLGLPGRVHWAGVRDEGWQLLMATDLYVQPSRSEGVPLAVLEAMALGLPVVASGVGGIREAVVDDETGLLVEPDSPDKLAEAITALLAQPSRLREMGQAGQIRYQKMFRGESSVERLAEKYFGLEGA
ncbi:MAG TPA: glycosyltransferase, partial [Candidatus Polarisedimenticolia bacterium]|nr:glycosyltransferase [Candidatus Polarisedimenticolia bacterium]